MVMLCFPVFIFAETIVLKSGKTIDGKIIERTDKYVKIDFYGVALTYFLDEIQSIAGENINIDESSRLEVSNPESHFKKDPSLIFKEVAPAVVVIIAIKSSETAGQGSGFIVSEDGIILTNFHILAGSGIKDIQVRLKDGRMFPVKEIIDCDRRRDVCVLKIEANKLPFISLGDSDKLSPGEKILVIGAPEGLEYSISDGLFSQKRKIKQLGSVYFLQISAPFSGGASGSPLLDMQGKVVGINSYSKTEAQNINLAIPINEVKKIIHSYSKINTQEFDILSRSYALFCKGGLARGAGDDNTAFKFYQDAIAIDPNFADVHAELGLLYGKIFNRVDDAIIEFKKAIAIDPNTPGAYANLGTAYAVKGMIEEFIIAAYEKALDVDPYDSETHINLAKSYYISGKYDLAIQHCEAAIKLGGIVEPQLLNALEPYRKK